MKTWEQRKWIDVVDISTEMVNPTTGEYDNMPHIAPGNIESFTGRILDNVKTVKEEQLISGKFRFRPDDVVYGKINPQLGKYFYATVNGLTSADAYVFNGKNGLKQKFLFALLQTSDFFKYSVSVSKRSGMPKINRDELNAYSFLMPSEEEQDRIGSYLLQLDHLITLHQRKCEETKSLKKYMLQKMFPENGNCVPKIRFSGFADAWEQRKLKDYLEVSREKNKTESYGKEDVLSVSGEHGIVNQIEFQGRSFAGVSVANYGVVEAGDVVYTKSPLKSNPYGIIKTNKGKTGIVSTLYAVYKPRMNTNSEFVQIYFELDSRMNSYMHPLVNKGAKNDMKVSDENALKGPVAFPELEEQNAITQYFDKLDRLITLHQRKCYRFIDIALDAWEQRKLGGILKERTERAHGDEELLSVTIGNGVIRQIDSDKRNIASEDKSNYKVVKKGDIPYNSMRMWQGAVGNSEYDGIVSPAYTVLTPTSDANGKFFMELFKKESTLQIFQRWSQGLTSDTWNLKYPVLSSIQFDIPSVE